MSHNEVKAAYESQRTANMARNAEQMEALGLKMPAKAVPREEEVKGIVKVPVPRDRRVDASSISKRWFGRSSEIAKLCTYLGQRSLPGKAVLVHGATSTGKTGIVKEVVASSGCPYSFLNCTSVLSLRALLETTLNQLMAHSGLHGMVQAIYRKKGWRVMRLREALLASPPGQDAHTADERETSLPNRQNVENTARRERDSLMGRLPQSSRLHAGTGRSSTFELLESYGTAAATVVKVFLVFDDIRGLDLKTRASLLDHLPRIDWHLKGLLQSSGSSANFHVIPVVLSHSPEILEGFPESSNVKKPRGRLDLGVMGHWMRIKFGSLTMKEMESALVAQHQYQSSGPAEAALYSKFIALMLPVLRTTTLDLRIMANIAHDIWPKLYREFLTGRRADQPLPEDVDVRLHKLVVPAVSSHRASVGLHPRIAEVADPLRGQQREPVPMGTLKKYALVAAYIASHTPRTQQLEAFTSGRRGKKKKRGVGSSGMHEAKEDSSAVAAAFDLERMLAIIDSLMGTHREDRLILGSMQMLSQISDLVTLGQLERVTKPSELTVPKFRSRTDLKLAETLAEGLGLPLAQYLTKVDKRG